MKIKSILNKRKIQNSIKEFNKIYNKKIVIQVKKGKWNGYTYPIEDKFITENDFKRLLNSKKLSKKSKENLKFDISPENIIYIKAKKYINDNYPYAPDDLLDNINYNYCNNSKTKIKRKLSTEFLKRINNLIVAYVRHNYTLYNSYNCDSNLRKTMRKSYNNESQIIINQWRK